MTIKSSKITVTNITPNKKPPINCIRKTDIDQPSNRSRDFYMGGQEVQEGWYFIVSLYLLRKQRHFLGINEKKYLRTKSGGGGSWRNKALQQRGSCPPPPFPPVDPPLDQPQQSGVFLFTRIEIIKICLSHSVRKSNSVQILLEAGIHHLEQLNMRALSLS